MSDDPRELQAQAIAAAMIARIEAAGFEARADTLRRIHEIQDRQLHARVLELLSDYHRRKAAEER